VCVCVCVARALVFFHACLENGFYVRKFREGTYKSARTEKTKENVV
jgi:hypothetical protein